jgi:hypothetical protein
VSIWRLIRTGPHEDIKKARSLQRSSAPPVMQAPMSSHQQASRRYLNPEALERGRASLALFHDGDAVDQWSG